MNTDIEYKITPASLGGHRFDVELTLQEPDSAGVVLSMPAWIPGSYLIRDFSKHVGKVRATSAGKDIRVRKKNKHTWRVAPASGTLVISYEVYAHDLSVRGAHLDSTHGFFNGSSVFMCVANQHDQPIGVEIMAPLEATEQPWRVATTLPRDGASEWGFGKFLASDYDELIDHPVEMGVFTLVSFKAANVPHYFVLTGKHRCLETRLARDAKKICEQQIALFGELPAMERYLFLTRVEGSGYGGLEHRSSCALVCSRHELPRDNSNVNDDYRRFLGLVSHEYFHLWNIKRIKPAVFLPYDLQAESYTEQLWIFEGITSYYDDLALIRSGVIDEDSYLELLAEMINRVREGYGRQMQSLADSSFDAWVKFYKPDSNTGNAVVSYYKKGALVALALDLTIRLRTSGKHTLDDIMQAMWTHYGKPASGVPEDGFEEVVDQVTGLSMRPFFDALVRDVGDVPLESLLTDFGLVLKEDEPKSSSSAGNSSGPPPETETGITLDNGSNLIKSVRRGSCAETAGVSAGDELLALDALKVNNDNLTALLVGLKPGETITAHVFRGDQLLQYEVCLDPRRVRTYKVAVNNDNTPRQRQARRRWLMGTPVHAEAEEVKA